MRKVRKEDYFILAVFLMDYHSGQWSRGYRLLSRLGPMRLSDWLIEDSQQSELYTYLAATYGEKV